MLGSICRHLLEDSNFTPSKSSLLILCAGERISTRILEKKGIPKSVEEYPKELRSSRHIILEKCLLSSATVILGDFYWRNEQHSKMTSRKVEDGSGPYFLVIFLEFDIFPSAHRINIRETF